TGAVCKSETCAAGFAGGRQSGRVGGPASGGGRAHPPPESTLSLLSRTDLTADLAGGEHGAVHVRVGDAVADRAEELRELPGRDSLGSRTYHIGRRELTAHRAAARARAGRRAGGRVCRRRGRLAEPHHDPAVDAR